MPPKKTRAGSQQPVRRSSRIQAASSRASSVAPDDSNNTTADGLFPSRPTEMSSLPPQREMRLTAHDSVVQDSGIAPPRPQLQPPKKAAQPASTRAQSPPLFDVYQALGRIIKLNDRKYINTLTQAESVTVINALADRDISIRDRVEDLEFQNETYQKENAKLKEERDNQRKYAFRRALEQEEARKRQIEAAKAEALANAAKSSNSSAGNADQRDPSAVENAPASEDNSQTTLNLHSSSPVTRTARDLPSTPATVHSPASSTKHAAAHAQTEPPKPTSLFRRLFDNIPTPFSPFSSYMRKTAPAPIPPAKPLGDLTGSRKRTFTEVDPRQERPALVSAPVSAPLPSPARTPITPASIRKTSNTSNKTYTARAQTVDRSLATISEHSEERTDTNIMAPEPTPSRQPRSINRLRRRWQDPSPSQTPARPWTHQPSPREPNADARLQKLREYRAAEEKYKKLREDEEIKGMVERAVKRVKIDDLVKIPHHRPGESSSTFRMYDADSDDEMEVDEDVPVRDNMFRALSQNDATPPPSTIAVVAKDSPLPQPNAALLFTSMNATQSHAPTEPVKQHHQVALPAKERPLTQQQLQDFIANIPSVGKLPASEWDRPADDYLAAKFKFGFEQWKRNGKVIDW